MKKFKERIYPVLFMLVITVFFISVLAFINYQTKEKIKSNEESVLKKAVLYSANLKIPSSIPEIAAMYENRTMPVKEGEETFYIVFDSGQKPESVSGNILQFILTNHEIIQSLVFVVQGAGLWGEIQATIGIKPDFKTLTGIEFLKQSETPGLGARIAEEWYKNQFRDKKIPVAYINPGTTGSSGSSVEAVTGASITSGAVLKMINENLKNILVKYKLIN